MSNDPYPEYRKVKRSRRSRAVRGLVKGLGILVFGLLLSIGLYWAWIIAFFPRGC